MQLKNILPINLFLSTRISNEGAVPIYNTNATNAESYINSKFSLHVQQQYGSYAKYVLTFPANVDIKFGYSRQICGILYEHKHRLIEKSLNTQI